MTGHAHGMATEMIKLVNQKCNANLVIGVDVHCLWCIDHRLNLVAQDFREVPNINFVIAFIKWITANDRQVSYRSFVKTTSQNIPKKKIPPPSETRWLLYRDTLSAVMDQTDTIERFMNLRGNREKWNQFLATQKFPLGEIKDVPFSFDHPLVRAHFQFAKDLLDILGDLNELFQMKYSFVNNLWDHMSSLYQFLVGE